jgi:hypothetical protein
MDTAKKIGFVVSPGGEVVKYQGAARLTRHQRATLYFKALRIAKALLQEVGFRAITDCGHAGFTIEMDHFLLEVMVQEPPQIAHVTSYQGYSYDPRKVTAKVTMMLPTENRDYVIRAMATVRGMTLNPVFIVVGQDSSDLLKEAVMNVLLTTRDFMSRDPALLAKIKAGLASRDLERDYERLAQADVTPPSLPE